MHPVRTALIGLGYWGPNLLRNFGAQAECDMVAVCDLSTERLSHFRSQYPSVQFTQRIEDIWKDPSIELVLIATPTRSHFPLAVQALEAGKHVFVEKPMTETPEQAETLVALATQKHLQLFVDHTFVFAPAVDYLQAIVQRGDLGSLLYFESSRINLGLFQRDVNVVMDLAIHDLSILQTLVDLEDTESIRAIGASHFGQQVEQAHLHIGFRTGMQAHIHVSWLSPLKIRQTILGGTKAMALYDDTQPSEKIRVYDRGVERDVSHPDPFFPKYRSGDILIPTLPNQETLSVEAEHVLRCVQGLEEPRSSGAHGAAIVRLLHLANQSLAEGGTIVPVCPTLSSTLPTMSNSAPALSSAIL